MSDRTFRQFLKLAAQISDRAADPTGFVPLFALAREVQADVRFRPLLVEGIAAQPKAKDGRWLILVDSETHRISDELFASENANRPFGSRVRNTIAHELAHALGPRCQDAIDGSEKTRKELVDMLERETEQLSPALLVPPRALEALVKARSEPFDISELAAARDRLGISSRVFIKRLELLSYEPENPLRYHPRLDNLAIGSGEWLSSTRAELHPTPFRGTSGLVPEFVAGLRKNKQINAADYFPDPDFLLNGGPCSTSSATLWIGTNAQPQSEKSTLDISVEIVPKKRDSSFLWLARGQNTRR